jgi:hypothetical protein
MFSARTDWNLKPNRLTELLEAKRRRGESVIDLTESNPTLCGLQFEPEILARAFDSAVSHPYEPNPKGLLIARNSVAEYYKERGAIVKPDNVILTSGTSEAYSFLFRLLCNPGDSLLIPKPSYPLLDHLCQLNDVRPSFYRLMYDGEWRIDFESLRKHASGAKALVLVHPNNPTGSFIKQDEVAEILTLARENQLSLIVDEVFSDYGLEGQHRAGTFANTDSVLSFTLGGISKLLGLPQMKLSWIVASGPGSPTAESVGRLEFIADTYLSVNTPLQRCLPSLMQEGRPMTARILERVRANLAALHAETFAGGLSLLLCEGGWQAVLRVPQTRSDEDWAELILESANILVHPGHFYSFDDHEFIVISLLPEPRRFTTAARTLTALFKQEIAVNGSL